MIEKLSDRLSRIASIRHNLCEDALQLEKRIEQLESLINHPETDDWFKGVQLEAAHQVDRWGTEHDEGKQALDWFWLIGYLAQKAATSHLAGDDQKAKHHTISTAAVLLNWHRRMSGTETKYQPGSAEIIGASDDEQSDGS